MKKIVKIIAITTLIFATSCGKDAASIVDNRTTVNVKTNTPTSSKNNLFISASGKVEAVQNANLSTRMMGYVDNIYVNVGNKVTKGDLLLSINSADINAQKAQVNASITEATAAFKNAEKDYNRFTALFKENSASQKEMDDMTAHFEMSKARLEAANQMKNQVNAQLSYSNIKAPFSGVITGKFVNKGDMANPGIPLISIETPGKYQVIAMVPESEITSIQKETSVNVIIKTTNELLKGKVTEVSSSAQNTGGQYLVKVILDKTDANILSGMFTSVQFPIEKNVNKNSLLLIPENALVKQGQLSGVYTIGEGNVAILRWLRIGKTFGNQVEVLSGLSADEQYIVSADGKLFNGAKINVQ
ncbi:MAG: efflux RND transporter periplasmic adaptor subunit [Lutibacter sp.]|uniref:efflux RND transporter periplasmic adaptor subunit n=1 Tax=Lutibacter sp. TaxID=1925666 RepID=UPI00182FA157|nr:efflux RND transporter periplasmic adaptor subunit [Lutibacter sp.]MBT8317200.1 efflux RND transporter periplasmic adaptor subunit [Lutibacter sp.]NNJ58059.1 efflux RND transporter periplasmic adaptor subunit [Lutibacter sp.]